MKKLEGEQILLRIFIGESDKAGGKPLYEALVEKLRQEQISGATVLRGILGYGARSILHSANILQLSHDLPIIIEAVDTPENIDRVLPHIESIIGDGLITMEKVRVLHYGTKDHSAM
jgi:PII-like signaling protein